ncbi:hypothetical protein VTN31DRAFT_4457 [Thermomyces dupontii]|uniref:uncharacterized protein n=1 Tax=Talaromyces thermophilus TaxID=28565 RepID=UPI00374276DE
MPARGREQGQLAEGDRFSEWRPGPNESLPVGARPDPRTGREPTRSGDIAEERRSSLRAPPPCRIGFRGVRGQGARSTSIGAARERGWPQHVMTILIVRTWGTRGMEQHFLYLASPLLSMLLFWGNPLGLFHLRSRKRVKEAYPHSGGVLGTIAQILRGGLDAAFSWDFIKIRFNNFEQTVNKKWTNAKRRK